MIGEVVQLEEEELSTLAYETFTVSLKSYFSIQPFFLYICYSTYHWNDLE